jgi:hypothetical protein
MTESLDEGMRAMGNPADYDTAAARGTTALTKALADLTADAIEGCTLEQVAVYGLYTDGRSGYAGYPRRTITPDELRAVLAENQRLTDAVEQLNALILRSLPNDGSEIPQPDDPWWRAQLDGVVDAAAGIYATAMRDA